MSTTRARRAADTRPLAGRTIVVTRAAAQAQRFVQLLESAGARVVHAPTIVVEAPPSWEPLDAALDALDTFTWVVFTSVNGVAMLDRRLGARGLAWPAWIAIRSTESMTTKPSSPDSASAVSTSWSGPR